VEKLEEDIIKLRAEVEKAKEVAQGRVKRLERAVEKLLAEREEE
jgi:hypothetical protein